MNLFKILRYSGIPFLFRELIQRNKVSIFMFHDIDVKTAEMSFGYLSKNYNLISLDLLLEAFEKKEFNNLPPKSAIITFDDGHIGNFDLLPLIVEKKNPISIFVCAGIINTNRSFWFKYLKDVNLKEQLKKVPNQERLEVLAGLGFAEEKEFDVPHALQNWQLEVMKAHINIQSHTLFHPILPNCETAMAFTEIEKSKKILDDSFNINAIAYPNGDFTDREIELVKKAGYKCALTTEHGFNSSRTNVFKLKRITTCDTKDIDELIVRCSGAWGEIRNILCKLGLKKDNKIGNY